MLQATARFDFLRLVLVLALAAGGVRAVAEEHARRFALPIYAWIPDYDFELASGQKGEITQDDILSNLDMAFMAQPRVQRGHWSVVVDFVYMKLSNKDRAQVLPSLDLRRIQLQQYLITPTVGYQIYQSGRSYADIYAGARYIWIEPTLRFQSQPPLPPGSFHESKSEDRWDAVLGVRGNFALDQRWYIPYEADAGTGQSDHVLNLMLGIGYRFQKVDAILAYRYLDYEFGKDWALKTITPRGPLIGVVFRF